MPEQPHEQDDRDGLDRRTLLRAAATAAGAVALTASAGGTAWAAEPAPLDPGTIRTEFPDPAQVRVDLGRRHG